MAKVTLHGVWLLDPADPAGTVHQFRFNGDGAEESYEREAVKTRYSGRRLPVVDFGEAIDVSIRVRLDTESNSRDLRSLRDLIDRQTILMYRDTKGRLIYGYATTVPVTDAWWGASTELQMTAVDYDDEAHL